LCSFSLPCPSHSFIRFEALKPLQGTPSVISNATALRTVHAFAATEPHGQFKQWTYVSRPLGPEDVEIKISHCGICGSDIHTLDSGWEPTAYPVVTGHEIVGEVTAAGPEASLAVGDRVGVGAQVWACLNKDKDAPCEQCAEGFDPHCPHKVFTYNSQYKDGEQAYGGYADYVRVSSNYAFKIPDNIPSDVAAPLLCAGVTVFSPLKHEGVKAGDRVGVIGIGGLGHLAIQFIRAMGAIPIAFSRSANKEQEVRALGAQEFFDLSNPEHQTKAVGSVNKLVLTADADNMPYNLYLSLLKPRGSLIMLGLPNDEVKFKPFYVVGMGARVVGSLIGSIEDIKDMLKLASEQNVRPIIQKLPMDKVNDGIAMVRSGKVRYRVVLEN
jgi:alcohol dehydrogenase (NADP+)